MADSRTKNVSRSIAYGTIARIVTVIAPFISRTVLIYSLGMEYVGLRSLMRSVIGVLGLAEAGVGSALVYCMYEPAARGNREELGGILLFYKKCYRFIGIMIGAVGILLLPFLEYFIEGDIPADVNIYWLFLIYLSSTVLSYLMFAYRQSLFIAYQRNDMVSRVSIICNIAQNAMEIVLLVTLHNYYAYAIVSPLITCANNLIIRRMSDRLFPDIAEKGKIAAQKLGEIKRNVVGLFFQKIGNIVYTSADSIVISAFLGLVVLGRYNNYYYIISSLLQFCIVIENAMTPSIWNSLVTESEEKN